MSGDIADQLRDPVIYPHWMWVAGLILILAVIIWVTAMIRRWWRSDETRIEELQTISQVRRDSYHCYVNDIEARHRSGELDSRDAHLAVAGLMRALGTERTGRDLEVATVAEVRQLLPMWPALADLLQACESPSFDGNADDSQEVVTRILHLAHQAVDA
ncbi:hypothetical protein [Schaalia vaccimaxillae]|uniref:hypothetical protein n=1 Tax=Schaalia vaccimaxillae TaxID=183916 RepID=UPI0003B40780|nr:hypothetical protein [Schaalia vaccimaxillae]